DANNTNPGRGGRPLDYSSISLADRITMGGGGGAGNEQSTAAATAGLNGGGAIFFRATALSVTGSISANGQATPPSGADDGQGGGGAGGNIYIRLTNAVSGCTLIHADGSKGIDAVAGLAGARGVG